MVAPRNKILVAPRNTLDSRDVKASNALRVIFGGEGSKDGSSEPVLQLASWCSFPS